MKAAEDQRSHPELAAFHEGIRVGQNSKLSGVECPYSHEEIALRLAWFDGFAKGRTDAQAGSDRSPE